VRYVNVEATFKADPPPCCESCLRPEAHDLRDDVARIKAGLAPTSDLDWTRHDLYDCPCHTECPWRAATRNLLLEVRDRLQKQKVGATQPD